MMISHKQFIAICFIPYNFFFLCSSAPLTPVVCRCPCRPARVSSFSIWFSHLSTICRMKWNELLDNMLYVFVLYIYHAVISATNRRRPNANQNASSLWYFSFFFLPTTMQCSDSTPADWLIQKKSFAAYQFQCVSLLMIVCICAQCISSGRSLSFHYWWWLLFFFFLLCSLPFIYYLRSVGKVKEQCSRSVVLAYYIVSIYAAMDPVLPSDGCIHTTHIHMRTAHTQNTLFCSGGARRPAPPFPSLNCVVKRENEQTTVSHTGCTRVDSQLWYLSFHFCFVAPSLDYSAVSWPPIWLGSRSEQLLSSQ